MIAVKHNTATTIIIGPFLDADGVPVTGLTMGDIDAAEVYKPDSSNKDPIDISEETLTSISNGRYSLTLSERILDATGTLNLFISKTASFIQIWEYIDVIGSKAYGEIYDSGRPNYDSITSEISLKTSPRELASSVWGADLEYMEINESEPKTSKAWLMLQSLFSIFKQKTRSI